MAIILLTGTLFMCWNMTSCTLLKAENQVNTAYDLRMNGHADSAVILLNNIIKDDPENASAYYELARAKMHILLSGRKYVIKDIIADASKASELDPDNEAFAYFKAKTTFLNVYMQLMQGSNDVQADFQASVDAFEDVLKIEACCPSVLISLTEIYSMLPEEMGGNRTKAETYAAKLESCDPVQGLKATALLQPNEEELLNYWIDAYENNEENAVISEELGRAYLMNGDIESAKKYMQEAHRLNPENCMVLIDLGRATMMLAMESQDKKMGEDAINVYQEYLTEYPDAPDPMKAYIYGMMGLTCNRIIGNQTLADEYISQKNALDPFCSRAFGSPSLALFVAPGEMYEGTGYYSRPF